METLPPDYGNHMLVAGFFAGGPPAIDGVVEARWDSARPIEVAAFGGSGAFPLGSGIQMRALTDSANVYLLIQWPDSTRDYSLGAWELSDNSTPEGTWARQPWGDDQLTVYITDERDPAEPGLVDVWTWSASRTNPLGFADDLFAANASIINTSLDWGYQGDGPDPWTENNMSTIFGPRPQFWNDSVALPTSGEHIADADKAAMGWPSVNSSGYPNGWRNPGWILQDPGSGSRGDVRAFGTHNGTGWTLEMMRPIATADAGTMDIGFQDAAREYPLSLALYNNQTGFNESTSLFSYRLILAEFDQPNLLIGGINPDDDSPLIGNDAALNVSVANNGFADSTGPTRLTIWDDAAAAEVANVSAPAISWGTAAVVAVTFPTGNYTPGLRNFTATIDRSDDEIEIYEFDNDFAFQFFFTDNPADPDVVFDSIEGPTGPVFAGGDFRVNGTIRNVGPGDAGPAIEMTASHGLFGASSISMGPLFANQTANFSIVLSSTGVPTGSYNISVEINPQQDFFETSYANNLAGAAVTVETRPDLVVSNIIASPAALVAGGTINLTVNITNKGAPAAGTALLWIYLDDNASTGITGRVLDWPVVFDLANEESVATSVDWTTSSLYAEGNHSIRGWIDAGRQVAEANEANNNGSAPMIILPPVRPDLTILNASIDAASFRTGDLGNVTVIVANLGINYSTDVTLRLIDASLNRELAAATITPVAEGTNRSVALAFTAPAGFAGTHALQLLIDADDDVNETPFELNNAFALSFTLLAPVSPDLIITSLTFFPVTPTRGDVVDITATVANNGNGAAGACEVAFLFGLTEIGRVALPPLQPGGNSAVTFSWNTSAVTGLQALVAAEADAGSVVPERDESNNYAEKTLAIARPGSAAYELTSIRVEPTDVETGATVRVEIAVRNNGTGTGPAVVRLKVDGLTVLVFNLSLGPGENVTLRANLTALAAGNHLVRAELEINGLGVDQRLGSYRVPNPVAPPPSPVGIIVALGALAAFALLALFLVRKPKGKPMEPEKPPSSPVAESPRDSDSPDKSVDKSKEDD